MVETRKVIKGRKKPCHTEREFEASDEENEERRKKWQHDTLSMAGDSCMRKTLNVVKHSKTHRGKWDICAERKNKVRKRKKSSKNRLAAEVKERNVERPKQAKSKPKHWKQNWNINWMNERSKLSFIIIIMTFDVYVVCWWRSSSRLGHITTTRPSRRCSFEPLRLAMILDYEWVA